MSRRAPRRSAADDHPIPTPRARIALILILTLVWGCNWPVLKMGVTELAPLTFRGSRCRSRRWACCSSRGYRATRFACRARCGARVAVLAILQHRGLERARAVRRAAAARGPQRDPRVHDADLGDDDRGRLAARAAVAAEARRPGTRRCGHGRAARRQIGVIRAAPLGALMILGAAIAWAFGTVLLRKWQPPIAQNTLSGWMMLLGWLPLAVLAPLFDPQPWSTELANLSARGWFADRLQHLPRRHARALGVVHAGAHAAGGRVVAVVAAGAGGRRDLRHRCCWASGPGRRSGSRSRWWSPRCSPCCSSRQAGACRDAARAGRLTRRQPVGASGELGNQRQHAALANHGSRFALHRSPIACASRASRCRRAAAARRCPARAAPAGRSARRRTRRDPRP